MTTDTIPYGETYSFSVSATDENGDAISLDGIYTAAVRIRRGGIDGPVIIDLALDLTDGASNSIDTGDDPWTAGTYYYDIRFTDGDGNDFWSPPVRLVLSPRVTPAS